MRFEQVPYGSQFKYNKQIYTKIRQTKVESTFMKAVDSRGFLTPFLDNVEVDYALPTLYARDLPPGQKFRFASNPNDEDYWYMVVNALAISDNCVWVINNTFDVHKLNIDGGNPQVVLVD